MLIKNIKRQQGFIEIIMVIALMFIIIMSALTLYSATKDEIQRNIINWLIFTEVITLSKSDNDKIVLRYDEIIPFQKAIFKKTNCIDPENCKLLEINRIPANSYIIINYKNGSVVSFTINSKHISSAFISQLRRPSFLNVFSHDSANNELVNKEHDEYRLNYLLKDITVYSQLDKTGKQVSNSSCQYIDCTSIFEYKATK